MFSQKDRYVFRKRSACFSKKVCMFFEKDTGAKISLCLVKIPTCKQLLYTLAKRSTPQKEIPFKEILRKEIPRKEIFGKGRPLPSAGSKRFASGFPALPVPLRCIYVKRSNKFPATEL